MFFKKSALLPSLLASKQGGMAYKCSRCRVGFATRHELGGHLSKGILCTTVDEPLAGISDDTDSCQQHDDPGVISSNQDGTHEQTETMHMQTIDELLQRPCAEYSNHLVLPIDQIPGSLADDADESNSFKLFETQQAFTSYCNDVRHLYSDDFWRVFGSVYQEKMVVIEKVLRACKDVLQTSRRFETSVRELRKKMLSDVGDFNVHLLHEIDIDLHGFGLPNVGVLKFRFVNPLWAWTVAANDMLAAGNTIHFVPKTMLHKRTREQLYGESVVFGQKLKLAASQTPGGGKPGLCSLIYLYCHSGTLVVVPV